MLDPRRNTLNIALSLILLLYLHLTLLEATKTRQECPIGYELAFTKTRDKVCYSIKRDPEPFSGKFDKCTGNLFTLKLYNSLSLPKSELMLWTDYKSLYPGGPFVDWSYTDSTGDVLDTTYEVNRDPYFSVDEELCVAIDPVNNFTAVRCDEMHYRYCFVEAYSGDTSDDGCEDLTDGIRFWSPMQTCLTAVTGEAVGGRGVVRATWNQSQRLCDKRGGSIIGEGWRYSNYFKPSATSDFNLPMYPLNVVLTSNSTLLRYGADNYSTEIPTRDWHFDSDVVTKDTTLGAINNNDFWDLVNSSYIFYNVICERPVQLLHVELTVTINSGDELITLTVNDTLLQEDDIFCFTDSSRYYPQKVSIKPHPSDPNVYILKAIENGYYWCTHIDSQNFYISESNRALYVKVKESTENLYAVKIRTFSDYKLDKISKLLENVWKRKIEEYVFFSTKYSQTYVDSDSYDNYTIINYKKAHPGLRWEDRNIIQKLKLKRLYLDARTALLHVELYPDMRPVKPGQWENIVIEYMKPAYYCDKENKLSLGMSRSSTDCKNYICVGDYNDGVQSIITPQEGCYTPAPTTLLSAVNISDVTSLLPTVTTTMTAPTTNEGQPRHRSDSESSEEYNSTLNTTKSTVYTQHPNTTTDITVLVTDTTYEVSTFTNEVLTAETPTKRPRPTSTTTPPPPTTTTENPESFTRPPPDQQLQQVMDDLEDLLHNSTEPVMVEDISNAFTQVDELLDVEELEIPSNLLHLLDEIGARIDLNGSNDSSTVRENIALLVADAQPQLPVNGLRVAARDSDVFTNNTFEIIRENINSSQLSVDESEVVVALPPSVATSTRRISFVVFRNDRAFSGGHDAYFVNSRVLSVKVENITEFHEGEVIDIHLMPLTEDLERNQSRACAYWHFTGNGSGYWSQEGCTFIRSTQTGQLDTCRCDHLTHFAEVLVPRTVFSDRNEAALEILSIVGCITSIVGLIIVGLTAVLFRSWRRDFSNKIWLQLCLSIFLMSVCFLVIVFAKFQEYDFMCTLTGVVLHYTVLASFCWMLVAAVLSYRRLVTVFTRDASHKLLRASAFAWGTPCAIVGILLSIAPQSYAGRYEDKSPSGAFCYPSGLALWLSVYTPIAVMLLANWTLFVLIVRSVFASRRIQRHGDTNEALRCASVSCLLVFLFGLPWIFGLFSFNVVSAYFFTIFVTLQGFVLFVFFVLGNKKTRDLWLNKLKIKRSRKVPVTSSTYTNRSTAANVPSRGNRTPASIEANASKPRSLSSLDNSRFS